MKITDLRKDVCHEGQRLDWRPDATASLQGSLMKTWDEASPEGLRHEGQREEDEERGDDARHRGPQN